MGGCGEENIELTPEKNSFRIYGKIIVSISGMNVENFIFFSLRGEGGGGGSFTSSNGLSFVSHSMKRTAYSRTTTRSNQPPIPFDRIQASR